MAERVSFDFEPWVKKDDVPLHRPGTDYGFGSINGAHQFGHNATRRQDDRDATIGPAIDGVVGILAGALEWLREYGMTPAEVQNRVKAYIAKNRGSNSQQLEKTVRRFRYVDLKPVDGVTAEEIAKLS